MASFSIFITINFEIGKRPTRPRYSLADGVGSNAMRKGLAPARRFIEVSKPPSAVLDACELTPV